jgi:hypothetical protein
LQHFERLFVFEGTDILHDYNAVDSGSMPRVRAGRRMRWLEETLKPLRPS